MKILQTETTLAQLAAAADSPVADRQVRQLVSFLDKLSAQLKLRRPGAEDPELSHQEFKALLSLAMHSPTIMTDLAGNLAIPLSTATHTIDKLVDKGLAERVRPTEDRRIVQVSLSKKGKQLYSSYHGGQLAQARSMLGTLSTGEREIFLELMVKMMRIEETEAEAEV
jgi:DNA-binding MarR family transcriptional regulator